MRTTKVIRIDKEVFDALVKNAKGFETPNRVLRRLLKLENKIDRNKKTE